MIEWILFQLGKYALCCVLAVLFTIVLVFCVADQIGKADNLRDWIKYWIKNKFRNEKD